MKGKIDVNENYEKDWDEALKDEAKEAYLVLLLACQYAAKKVQKLIDEELKKVDKTNV